jgi:hypothetical protein
MSVVQHALEGLFQVVSISSATSLGSGMEVSTVTLSGFLRTMRSEYHCLSANWESVRLP